MEQEERLEKIATKKKEPIQRHSITIDPELEKRLRAVQSEIILVTGKSCTFSRVIAILLKNGLKHKETLEFNV